MCDNLSILFHSDFPGWLFGFGGTAVPSEGCEFSCHNRVTLASLSSLALHLHVIVLEGDFLCSTGEQLS